jgi:hypothetical protein
LKVDSPSARQEICPVFMNPNVLYGVGQHPYTLFFPIHTRIEPLLSCRITPFSLLEDFDGSGDNPASIFRIGDLADWRKYRNQIHQ